MTIHGPRVLLLEDNPALAESIEFALMTFGLEVAGPYGANHECLGELAAGELDVAILDLDLGSETSLPTAERLRRAGIPFVFMSGHDMEDEIPATFQDEVCLPKPIAPETLVETIHELVELTGLRNTA